MNVERIVVGYLKENCYLINKNNKVLIIDPGDEAEKIISAIHGEVVGILVTHNHFDHIGALNVLINKYHVLVNNYNLADFDFSVINTPGHTMDSKTFYFKEYNLMFTGDFIFKGSIGRTDLGGSDEEMIASLKMIINYPDDIIIYPGHGESSTLRLEKNNIKNILDYN